MTDNERLTVCDGCWKRGRCESLHLCRCSCTNVAEPWNHVDNPRVTEVYDDFQEGLEY